MDCSGKSNRIILHLRFELVTSSLSPKAPDSLFITHITVEFDLLGRYRS